MTSLNTTTRTLIGAALFVLALVPSFAATADDCFSCADPRCPIGSAKADWRSLSHGIHLVPGQTIVTGDGRRLAGSAINYARVPIDRADEACKQLRDAEELALVQEAQTLLHPAPRR